MPALPAPPPPAPDCAVALEPPGFPYPVATPIEVCVAAPAEPPPLDAAPPPEPPLVAEPAPEPAPPPPPWAMYIPKAELPPLFPILFVELAIAMPPAPTITL